MMLSTAGSSPRARILPNREGDTRSASLRSVVENHRTATPEQATRDQNVGADIHIGVTAVSVKRAEVSGKPITISLVGPAGDDVRQRQVKAPIILLKLAAPEPLMGQRMVRSILRADPLGVLEGVADDKPLAGLHAIAQQDRALPVGHADLEEISADSRGPLEPVNGEDDARVDILQRAAHRLFLVQVFRDRRFHRTICRAMGDTGPVVIGASWVLLLSASHPARCASCEA